MSFYVFMGNESERGTNKAPETSRFSGDLCVPRSDLFPMNLGKKKLINLLLYPYKFLSI